MPRQKSRAKTTTKPKSNTAANVGDEAARAKDGLGCVYAHFLAQFASVARKKGSEFYTPSHVVCVLVESRAPHKGPFYRPLASGSGGVLLQSEKSIEDYTPLKSAVT